MKILLHPVASYVGRAALFLAHSQAGMQNMAVSSCRVSLDFGKIHQACKPCGVAAAFDGQLCWWGSVRARIHYLAAIFIFASCYVRYG